MVTQLSRDDVLREAYASIPEAVEEIVSDPGVHRSLLDQVNSRLSPSEQFVPGELSKRLFTLRKRGADNGGLPRKHRAYSGRNGFRPKVPR